MWNFFVVWYRGSFFSIGYCFLCCQVLRSFFAVRHGGAFCELGVMAIVFFHKALGRFLILSIGELFCC